LSSREKRLSAARRKRSRISSQMRSLESGNLSIRSVLENPPPDLGVVRIWDLLCHTHKVGEAGAKKILTHARVWPEDKLKDLDENARHRIVTCLPPRAR
jgi:hypothetical protein